MKRKVLLFLFFILCFQAPAQKPNLKTRILLVGTFSFEKAAIKEPSGTNVDFQSPNRQKEILEFVNNKSFSGANKLFLEIPFKRQLYVDSVYAAYKLNNYKLSPNENEQIGFKLAKQLKLNKIYAIDDKSPIRKDSTLIVAAQLNDQDEILEVLNLESENIKLDFDSVLRSSSLTGILSYINSKSFQLRNFTLYNKYMIKVGVGQNYEGVQYVGDRYLRCLRIYANIISNVNPSDDFVIVFIGQGYLPFLMDFFEGNTDFEVVDYNKILH